MGGCFNKCCITVIAIGFFAAWLLLVNMKPDMLKNGFNSFIDMMQIRKTTHTTREAYTKKDSRYIEPSAFEQSK